MYTQNVVHTLFDIVYKRIIPFCNAVVKNFTTPIGELAQGHPLAELLLDLAYLAPLSIMDMLFTLAPFVLTGILLAWVRGVYKL